MRRILILLAVMSVPCSLPAADVGHDRDARAAKPVLWILPHTHWEGAVFKTREDYLQMGLPHILTALRLLKQFQEYRFALDQVAYYRPFLERYPEEAAAFKKFVAEGRLQIVGGMDVMPDDNMPSGESFVRQLLYGKGYTHNELGIDVNTGWLLDTFGHNAQIPQLLRLAGFDSLWYFRGVEDANTAPVQSLWEGLDGTMIRAIKPPFVFYEPPKNLKEFSEFIESRYESLAPFSQTASNRVEMDGVDVSDPELYVPDLVAQFNRQSEGKIVLRYGTPRDFEKAVATKSDLPVFKGERNPIYQGTYSSRIELKQAMREAERLLTTAEKFDAWAETLGKPPDSAALWNAWEPALFNVTHDLASGVMTDYVYEDTVRSYDFSHRLAKQLVDTNISEIMRHVDTRGRGVPIVVFNSLGWVRSGAAEAEVGFAAPGIHDFEVVECSGKITPAQIAQADEYQDNSLRVVKFVFVARDIPAMGYKVYHVLPRAQDSTEKKPGRVTSSAIENSNYIAAFDRKTGALTSLHMKQGDWDVLREPANVIAEEPENGDFWELNRALNGSQSSMTKQPVTAPERSKAKFSDEFSGEPATISRGPVFSEFHVMHAFGNNDFSTRVRIYNDLPRIDFTTTILNRDAHVRYRILFPITIKDGHNVQEIPFGAVERPQNAEFPAQNWIDFGNANRGVALLNRGLPGNNVADGILLLSLLRSVRIQSYNHVGGFEGQASDSGLELGKDFTFHYALLPHEGDWRKAEVYRAGLEFNNPLIVSKSDLHGGNLSPTWGLLSIRPQNVVMSALKSSGRDGMVLRIYEAAGRETKGASIQINTRLLSARVTNLLEDGGSALMVRNGAALFDLRPYEIKTLRLQLAP